MIELILKIMFLDVLWVLLFKIATEEGMILEKVGQWGSKMVDKGYMVFDGLITCPWCLPNFHGILVVWPLSFCLGIVPFEWNLKYLVMHVFIVGGASFICGVSWSLYKHLELKHKYYEHLEQQEWFNLKERKNKHYNSKNKP